MGSRAILTTYLLLLSQVIMATEPAPFDDAMPFGPITEVDVKRLDEFAKKMHSDLIGDTNRLYQKGGHDRELLCRLFRFSLVFGTLDNNARTYGQIIWSSLLNLGECLGVEEYTKILDTQPPDVQQRVRDFLYFPITLLPEEARRDVDRECREAYPTLFPPDFYFGCGDQLFSQQNDVTGVWPTCGLPAAACGVCINKTRRALFPFGHIKRCVQRGHHRFHPCFRQRPLNSDTASAP